MELTTAKPFLKWAGGKAQLLSKFQDFYPKQLKENKIKCYYEPFLGSGAVFFDIAQKFNIESAFLYDVNEELILCYKVIQKDVNRMIERLSDYQLEYLNLSKLKRNEFYYNQRNHFNLSRFRTNYKNYSEDWLERASQLIFLNHTCYNGLYRVNSKGEFNSPVGDYENPKIYSEKNLLAANRILQKAEIKKADYKELLRDLKPDSFVYFDPPYRPISKTANFKAYSKEGFNDIDQLELFKIFKQIDLKGSFVMLSNSDPKNKNPNDHFFDEMYNEYNILRVPARRMINSDHSKRGFLNEIVVTNYSNLI
jgi:DNA adenine methylase